MGNWDCFVPSLQSRDRLRKLACLFAGLGHLQPLLLATTNANYLLDRFCVERCCSSEYISRIVTSIIFMEILATLLVAPTGIGIGIKCCSTDGATGLVEHNKTEERYREPISVTVQLIITLGYMQILISFMTGSKKGHMEWFYLSLAIQYFFICIIAGAIGFWDVEHALWYLMAIPVGPIPVFFYQLMIHSWIRNHGPRDAEYLVVEWQILLTISISVLATACWTYGYVIPYKATRLTNLDNLNGLATGSAGNNITVQPKEEIILITQGSASPSTTITIFNGTVNLSSGNSGTVTIKVYSVTLQAGASADNTAIIYPRKTVQLTLTKSEDANSGNINITLTKSAGKLTDRSKETNVTLKLTARAGDDEITVHPEQIYSGSATFKQNGDGQPVNIQSVTISKIAISNIDPATGQPASGVTAYTIVGRGCYPNPGFYISGTSVNDLWKDEWDGGKCEFVECYYKDNGSARDPALLRFYVRFGGSLKIYYCGRNNDGWKTLSASENLNTKAEDKEKAFLDKFDLLVTTGSFTLDGQAPSQVYAGQHNTNYKMAITSNVWTRDPSTWNFTPIKYPVLMQGLSVGAVGSIFPNLIPKTLVCPKTTRTLSVINTFIVPLPHIINLALADNNCNPSSHPWEGHWPHDWRYSWFLYTFYIMAILFAIFNVHSPEWKLCSWIRNRTWFIFLMTLFTNVLNEVFNAISRGGIMTQRSAKNGGGQGKLLNHPLLWNKMACLLSLSYLPFWLTTTPMMKSYVSSLDPFLCDKDRDHWPTARYGRMKSFGYWCKCACRGLYNSPRKLVTLNMRKALTRKDPLPVAGMTILYGVLLVTTVGSLTSYGPVLEDGPHLFWVDYLASSTPLDKAVHGYGGHLLRGLLDKEYHENMSVSEAVALLKKCRHELKHRFLLSQSNFRAKIIDKNGVHDVDITEGDEVAPEIFKRDTRITADS